MPPTSPPFSNLPHFEDGLRYVNGMVMDEEQYGIEGWHIVGYYIAEDGTKVPYWKALLPWEPDQDVIRGKPDYGLRGYARLLMKRKADKKVAWETRQEEEDAFREYVDALLDAKAGGRP